ncbi:MAG TPA: hypothetical protein DCW68_07315 [Rhodospirillaceae bacterium]|nr:MAG: hypothetical protein A2018_06820 [Alphaproteobacteria bacterium GWF2_58_20]HAU29895.1 hypothetical protein [Rhodospirillaceae bacterium]
MDKGGADMPETPDPVQTAAEQYKLNSDTAHMNARLNNVNTTTPFGGMTWTETVDPDTGTSSWAQGLNFTGQGQQLFDNAFDYSSLPGLLGGTELAQQLKDTEQQAYDRSVALMAPQLQQQQASLMQNLSQRGLPVGGEAWNNAMTNYGQTQNQALTQAAQNAMQTALQQQAQLYGQSLSSRQQGLTEKTQPYSQMMNTLSAMSGGTGYNAVPTDYSSLVNTSYANEAQQAQTVARQQQQQQEAMMAVILAGFGL